MTQAWANNQWQVYTYNADGQRVRRKVDGVETWQIYGFDGELLAEYPANGAATSPQKEYGYRNGQLLIVTETSGGSAAAPSALAAVPSGGGASVTLSWSAASGATNYRVERKNAGGSYGLAGTTSSTGFIDSGVRAGSAYLYKVCAANGSGNCLSAYSNIALGAAVSFPTDSTITSSVTAIRAAHITELRSAVNAVRTLAGLPGASWTNPTVAPGMTISVYDVRDLREQLHQALVALGIQTSSYEDQTLAGVPNGTIIKRIHITQLRQRATSGSGGAGGGSLQFNLEWLVSDQLGTPRMIFDKTGSLAGMKRHDYLPFGEEIGANVGLRTSAQGYSQVDNVRQKFTSKERDNETALDYSINRYYSSTQGRFTSADQPFADQYEDDPQSWNLYSYVGNNPLTFTDPFGLWKWVDPDNNGNRFLQWEEGDDWHTLSTFLYNETGRDYLAGDLEKAYSSGGLGADTIVDVTGAPSRFFTATGGVQNVTFEHLAVITPAGRGANAGGGLISRLWKWATSGGSKAVTGGVAKRSIKEIAQELGYSPSQAVKAALKGRVSREGIPTAEREIAATFYERVANEVVSGPKQAAAKALNLARAKFLREGGRPPIDIHGFEP